MLCFCSRHSNGAYINVTLISVGTTIRDGYTAGKVFLLFLLISDNIRTILLGKQTKRAERSCRDVLGEKKNVRTYPDVYRINTPRRKTDCSALKTQTKSFRIKPHRRRNGAKAIGCIELKNQSISYG